MGEPSQGCTRGTQAQGASYGANCPAVWHDVWSGWPIPNLLEEGAGMKVVWLCLPARCCSTVAGEGDPSWQVTKQLVFKWAQPELSESENFG